MNRSSSTFLVAALLLGVLFAQTMTSIPRLSITFDEDVHITTGYSILRTGDLRLVEDHPPLLELWMSWPLLLSPQIPDPWDVPAWEQGDRRLFVRNEIWGGLPIDSWVLPSRIPIAWLALLLGAFLFRWTSDWFGPRVGILALAFFVFDPNILAHSALATLDLGVTCLIFIAMYTVQRLLRRPTWSGLILAGFSLGLALTAKISALILLPVGVGLMLSWGATHWRSKLIVRLGAYLAVAFLTWWAVHLFEFGPPPGLSFPLPAPTYWNSFLRVAHHVSGGDLTYLLGETYSGGRWYYFPVAFALKTPLPTLILVGVALVAFWRRPRRWWRVLALASLPVSYLVVSLLGSINLGYRHILPIVPFLYLFIARLVSRPTSHVSRFTHYVLRLTFYSLLLWQAIGALRVWPFHLTYFNEIAGGPENGYRYLADSNVDWGQGLKATRDYLEAESPPDVKLSSFTFFIRPELYGIEATPLPPLADAPAVLPTRFNPAPGTYVISASTLRGLQLIDREMYNWFWHREPDDVIANAMLVYHVPGRDPSPTWLAQCTEPAVPLSSEAVIKGFGRDDLRTLAFDCTQSWLYPDGGESAGWYVLHRGGETEGDFMRAQRELVRLVYEQREQRAMLPFAIYEWSPVGAGGLMGDAQTGPVIAAPSDWTPERAQAEGALLSLPLSFDGPLAFLGYRMETESATPGETLSLWTYWSVSSIPDSPLSLMAHLMDGEGRPVAVGDGLGVPVESWQVGDVIVQQHTLEIPLDAALGTYWVQTGVYALADLQRFAIRSDGQLLGDRIVLARFEVDQ